MSRTAALRTGCIKGPQPSGWLPPMAWATSDGPMVRPGPRSARSASMAASSCSCGTLSDIPMPHRGVEGVRDELPPPHDEQNAGGRRHEDIGAQEPAEIGERKEEGPLAPVE